MDHDNIVVEQTICSVAVKELAEGAELQGPTISGLAALTSTGKRADLSLWSLHTLSLEPTQAPPDHPRPPSPSPSLAPPSVICRDDEHPLPEPEATDPAAFPERSASPIGQSPPPIRQSPPPEPPKPSMPPAGLRRSVAKDRFAAWMPTQKTQTYHDPASRGPGSHAIRALAWSRTGGYIATGSADRTVRIWNPEKANVRNSTELRGHTASVQDVAWKPKSDSELASCSADGTVRLWDVRSGKCTDVVNTGGEGFTLAWKPDGKLLMVGRKDDALLPIHFGADGPPTAAAALPQSVQTNQAIFSWGGEELLLTTGLGTVKILTYPALETLTTIHAHTSSCLCLELCPRGRHLAVGGSDALISLWKTDGMWPQNGLPNMVGPVRSVSFTWDGAYVCGGSDEGTGIEIAHVDSIDYVYTLPTAHPAPYVAWHPHRYWLAYSGDPSGLKIVGPAL
ncbi:MAG: hypothetical protein M1832_005089 [Thelocarpon impressellum]|nr:MAG: hypothetical protein M1832_005089 [Thelocarpon impressellum]